MSRGSVSAADSVLLDYVSIWNVVALFKAAKRKHFFVVMVVVGTLSIRILTVFSTGLFSPTIFQINKPNQFSLVDRFDSTDFNPFNASTRSAATVFGYLFSTQSPPLGIHHYSAFELFADTSSAAPLSKHLVLVP